MSTEATLSNSFNGFSPSTHKHSPSATKYRIGLSLAQYKILASMVAAEKQAAIHPVDYDIELSLTYMQLTRMIGNIEGDLKKPDSSYVPDDRRKRARPEGPVTAESLGLSDDDKLSHMSKEEQDKFWADQEAGI